MTDGAGPRGCFWAASGLPFFCPRLARIARASGEMEMLLHYRDVMEARARHELDLHINQVVGAVAFYESAKRPRPDENEGEALVRLVIPGNALRCSVERLMLVAAALERFHCPTNMEPLATKERAQRFTDELTALTDKLQGQALRDEAKVQATGLRFVMRFADGLGQAPEPFAIPPRGGWG